MPEIIISQNNPHPEVIYQEIHLPNESELGTGTLRFDTRKSASTTGTKSLKNISYKPSMVSVYRHCPEWEHPILRVVFLLSDIDASQAHAFEVAFADWKIISLTMDGLPLPENAVSLF